MNCGIESSIPPTNFIGRGYNDDFPLVRFCGIPLRVILEWLPELQFCISSLKIVPLKFLPHLPGANELTHKSYLMYVMI